MSTRKFNGKIYKEDTFATNKKDADYIVNERRNSGMLSRRVKVKNGYMIYSRKK